MISNSTIENTAALFFFRRRHESWKKVSDGAAIASRSSLVFFYNG